MADQLQSPSSFWQKVEFNRFGIMAMTITAQSCLGSVGVFFVFGLSTDMQEIPLLLLALITMGANATAIAQAPARFVLGSFILSVITSIAVIVYALANT